MTKSPANPIAYLDGIRAALYDTAMAAAVDMDADTLVNFLAAENQTRYRSALSVEDVRAIAKTALRRHAQA